MHVHIVPHVAMPRGESDPCDHQSGRTIAAKRLPRQQRSVRSTPAMQSSKHVKLRAIREGGQGPSRYQDFQHRN
jgi:hypothetical protein